MREEGLSPPRALVVLGGPVSIGGWMLLSPGVLRGPLGGPGRLPCPPLGSAEA